MSISKRAFGVEGYKSTPRSELTLAGISNWFPNYVISEIKDSFIVDGLKIKKIRIDEAFDRKSFIQRIVNARL